MPPEPSYVRPPARLVVLISGRGRNLEAIQQAITQGSLHAKIVLVASNKSRAPGLQFARLAGLPTVVIKPNLFADRESYDAALARRVVAARPDWVVLAGFMRVLSEAFIDPLAGQIINIHPSLLPRHKGLHTHERALAAGDAEHGASVHLVTPTLDDGPVIRQARISVAPDDTPHTLADRVMRRIEQRLYPAALADLVADRIQVADGHRLLSPQGESYTPTLEDYD